MILSTRSTRIARCQRARPSLPNPGERAKPGSRWPDFPLFSHVRGYWTKQVRQKFHYFGKATDNPKDEAALELWLGQKYDLLAGRTPVYTSRRVYGRRPVQPVSDAQAGPGNRRQDHPPHVWRPASDVQDALLRTAIGITMRRPTSRSNNNVKTAGPAQGGDVLAARRAEIPRRLAEAVDETPQATGDDAHLHAGHAIVELAVSPARSAHAAVAHDVGIRRLKAASWPQVGAVVKWASRRCYPPGMDRTGEQRATPRF